MLIKNTVLFITITIITVFKQWSEIHFKICDIDLDMSLDFQSLSIPHGF